MERLSENIQSHTTETNSVELPKSSLTSKNNKPSSGGLIISNSAIDKFNTCPRMYQFHYKDKIREKRISSALLFGDCIDNALNELLLNKDSVDRVNKAMNTFNLGMSKWQYQIGVTYFKADADKRILKQFDIDMIDSSPKEYQDHLFGWFSLLRKGHEFIKKYNEEVLSKLHKVEYVQKKISKKDQYNNKIIGYVDFLATWSDNISNSDPCLFVIDNKTSSSSYSKAKIENSQQLSLYAWAMGLEDISYVVLRKDLDAKGNIRPIQILHGKRNDDLVSKFLDDTQRLIDANKDNIFPMTQNIKSCKYQFGSKCPYFDICHNNKDVTECDNLEVKK